MKKTRTILAVVGFIIVSIFVAYTLKQNNKDLSVVTSEKPISISNVSIANPASVNCTKLGGSLIIEKRGDGGEYGLCYFEENRACEEFALMRGDCPYGGRKTTGYDTIDQKYCAWFGGETFAVENSKCTFKNGKVCPTIDFYNGKCSSTVEAK